MPRDLHRLAAPAVFCNNVRRSVRRQSPCGNVSRQRDRLWNDRECEYDDYAAEIASYNRLRRGDRCVSNSYSSASRHTHESLPCYNDSTSVITPQSDARYFTSFSEKDNHLRVDLPGYRRYSHISDNYNRPSITRFEDDSQQKRHKRKKRHHHCHSQNRVEKRSENGSSSRPPRDTIAALKALADYGDANHCVSSVSNEHYDVSPRKSQRRESHERRNVTAVGNVSSEVIAKTEEAVAVNTECTRDDLSLGECTDDDDDDESVDMHTKQKSPRTDRSLRHVEQAQHGGKSSTDCSSSVSSSMIFSSMSNKKLHYDGSPQITESPSKQVSDITSNSRITVAMSSSESKSGREHLPIKHDKGGSDHSEGQSAVHLKHSPDNNETSVVDDRCTTALDRKHSTQHKSQSSESTQNTTRKKSTTGDIQHKVEDDTSLPRFVSCFFAAEVIEELTDLTLNEHFIFQLLFHFRHLLELYCCTLQCC